jgi:hypothetical protein
MPHGPRTVVDLGLKTWGQNLLLYGTSNLMLDVRVVEGKKAAGSKLQKM